MKFSSDRSLARIHPQQSRRHPVTIGSHAGIGIHPHMYNSTNPGTNTDIIRVDTSPHGVEIPTPPADFLIGHGSYVEPAPLRQDTGSLPPSRGRSTSISKTSINRGRKPSFLGSTPPCTVRNPQSRWLVADWFELHSAVLGGKRGDPICRTGLQRILAGRDSDWPPAAFYCQRFFFGERLPNARRSRARALLAPRTGQTVRVRVGVGVRVRVRVRVGVGWGLCRYLGQKCSKTSCKNSLQARHANRGSRHP